MDTNVPPYQTMLVADALIKANKDFDLLMLPNQNHGYGAGVGLHDAAAVGLLREVAHRRRAAEGVPDAAGGRRARGGGRRAATSGRASASRGRGCRSRCGSGGWSERAHARGHPPRRLGPVPGEQRPALLPPRRPVDPEKKFISGKNTIRFRMLKDDTRIQLDLVDALNVDKILLGTAALKYERGAWRGVRGLSRDARQGADLLNRLLLLGQPTRDRPLRRHRRSGRTPAGRHWINTACQGTGRQRLVAEQGSAARRSGEHAAQRRRFRATSSTCRTGSSWARRISATATRAGTGPSSIRSTTTASR